MVGTWGLAAALLWDHVFTGARGTVFRGTVFRDSTPRPRTRLSYGSWADLGAVPATREGWKTIFFVAAGFSALVTLCAHLISHSKICFVSRQRVTVVEYSVRVLKQLKLASRLY